MVCGQCPPYGTTVLTATLSPSVQNYLKNTPVSIPSGQKPSTGFLLAELDNALGNLDSSIANTSVWHDSSIENGTINHSWSELISGRVIPVKDSISQISTSQVGTSQIGSNENSISQVGTSQVTPIKGGKIELSTSQVGTLQIGYSQVALSKTGSFEISPTEITPFHKNFPQNRVAQIDPTEIGINQLISLNKKLGEISLPSVVTLDQIFYTYSSIDSHKPNPQNTTVPTWTEFLQSPTPFNLKIEIQDLPNGQLASGTITGYDTNGRPNSGTLTLDTDGNSLGWFIDTTPDDNTEFDQTLTTTAYRATTGAAAGKYDLLTTILHELGHLQGIISGNTAFDTSVQTIKGIPTFIDGKATATLTPDGSHLDSTLYPYDLMNTSLKPGVRKLPSSLDLSILNTIWSNKPTTSQQLSTTANLTAGALIGITNGDFTTSTTWNTAGATNIINGTATLTEQSQKLSELTQAFIIPAGASRLQFSIIDNHLIPGDTTTTANDAFVGEAFALAISRPIRQQHLHPPRRNIYRTQPYRLPPQHPSQRHHLQKRQSINY
jgi:hypothetical protein